MHAPGYHLIPCTSNLLFFTTPSSLYNCKLWNYLRLWQRKRAWYPAMKSSTLSPLVYTSVSKSDLSGFLHPRTFLWLHEQKIKKCPNGISLKKSSACFCHLLFLQSALQTTFVSDCAVLHKNFIACAMNWTVRHLQLGQPMSTFRSFGYVVASGSQKKDLSVRRCTTAVEWLIVASVGWWHCLLADMKRSRCELWILHEPVQFLPRTGHMLIVCGREGDD